MLSDLFCAMRYLSDLWYLPGDEKSRKRRRLSRSNTNLHFRRVALRSRAEYRKEEIMHVFTLRYIKV